MIEIILNPSGGSGKTLSYFEHSIRPLLNKEKIAFHLHFSSLETNVDAICRRITSQPGEHTIVIVGGDGTMNMAVNGIVHPENVKVGFIPCGSGNDLARALKMDRTPAHMVESIAKQEVVRRLDIGEAVFDPLYDRDENLKNDGNPVTRRFAISCGFGFDAAICAGAMISPLKKPLNRIGMGKLIYIATALKEIFTYQPQEATETIGEEQIHYPKLLFTAMMNTAYEGGGFRFCPEAVGTDGIGDYVIGENLSRFDFFRIFPYAYDGAHVRFNGVHTGRMQEIEITSEKPCWIHTDGEVPGKTTHLRMYLTKEQLQMIN